MTIDPVKQAAGRMGGLAAARRRRAKADPLYAIDLYETQRRLSWVTELKEVEHRLSLARYSDYPEEPNTAVEKWQARQDELQRLLWPEIYGKA